MVHLNFSASRIINAAEVEAAETMKSSPSRGVIGPDRTVGDREQDAGVTGNIESDNSSDDRNEPA